MPFRVIARLDIKGPNLIKGMHLEGLRVVGKPHDFAMKYKDAHEILYMDVVASLYGRNQLGELLEQTAQNTWIPITVGGGIKSAVDCDRLFRSGADKVAINTAAIKNPDLINTLSSHFGSQAITCSIEVKRVSGGFEAYTDNGRERTGRDAIAWAHEAVDRGAGEILLTSIDMEGTQRGFDLDLLKALGWVSVPVVISGGCGSVEHVLQAKAAGADGVAIAHAFHYDKLTPREVIDACQDHC